MLTRFVRLEESGGKRKYGTVEIMRVENVKCETSCSGLENVQMQVSYALIKYFKVLFFIFHP